MSNPLSPLDRHPALAEKRFERVIDWLNGKLPTSDQDHFVVRVRQLVTQVDETGAAQACPDEVFEFNRQTASAPAPWVGRAFCYRWDVATDQYGRQVAGAARIHWLEPKPLTFDPWPFWEPAEMVTVQDWCLLAIEDAKPLSVDWLDALPPWRAVRLARIAAATSGPVQQVTVEAIRARAMEVSGGAGPGWFTGRPGLTCAGCGHTTFHPENVRRGTFIHGGACQYPGSVRQRQPGTGGLVRLGNVLLDAELAAQFAP